MKPSGLLLLVLFAGCATAPAPSVPVDSAALAAKTARAEATLHDRFVSREGILIYRRATDPAPDAESGPYGDLADAACWGGYALGAEALRFSAEPTEEARASLDLALSGMELIAGATGVPGLLCRTVDRNVTEADLARRGGVWREVADPTLAAEGYIYRGDVSKDQYAGVLFGLGCVLRHVPDEGFRARAARIAIDIATHLDANDLTIVGVHGRPTTHGDLAPRYLGIPLAANAAIVLCAFRLSAAAGGPPEHGARYRELLADGWDRVASHAKVGVFGKTNRNNDHMAAAPLYHLTGLETDSAVRERYVRGLARIAVGVRGEGNALFLGIYMAAAGANSALLDEAWSALAMLPEDRVSRPVDNRGKVDGVVPIDRRTPSSFLWRSDPYELKWSPLGRKPVREYSPCDYLVAYWLLVAHQLFPPDETNRSSSG